jgi:hypothetical protein
MYNVKDFNILMNQAVEEEEEPKKKKLPLNRLFEMPEKKKQSKKPDGYKNTKTSESKKVKKKTTK